MGRQANHDVPTKKTCLAALQTDSGILKALKVQLKGEDIYVHQFGFNPSLEVHATYHASGERGIRVKYVRRIKSCRPPPASIEAREPVGTFQWAVDDLPNTLSQANRIPDFVVDTRALAGSCAYLTIHVSIVGSRAVPRQDVGGYPILASFILVGDISVELAAFCVEPS